MDLRIRGRVALVAAGSQGLGRAVAMALAAEGVRVAVCSRTGEAMPDGILSLVADVRDPAQLRGFVTEVNAQLGPIDIAVANAGGPPSKLFRDTTAEEWQAAIDTNLLSTVNLARQVLPSMCERQWGRFLTITSASVKQPIEGLVLSNSVRAAVTGLVKTLSNECAPYNVTVNNLCPGYTATARLEQLASDKPELKAKWLGQIPLGRFGTPEEFGAVATFLCSELAGYVTGVSLTVDGGFVRSL